MIEYLLTTGFVLVLFSSMYGFTHSQLKYLFTKGAQFILKAYY